MEEGLRWIIWFVLFLFTLVPILLILNKKYNVKAWHAALLGCIVGVFWQVVLIVTSGGA